MNDLLLLTLSASGLLAVALASAAGLKGWSGWLELRRLQLIGRPASKPPGRGELAELRARLRRLEAIANGAEI